MLQPFFDIFFKNLTLNPPFLHFSNRYFFWKYTLFHRVMLTWMGHISNNIQNKTLSVLMFYCTPASISWLRNIFRAHYGWTTLQCADRLMLSWIRFRVRINSQYPRPILKDNRIWTIHWMRAEKPGSHSKISPCSKAAFA